MHISHLLPSISSSYITQLNLFVYLLKCYSNVAIHLRCLHLNTFIDWNFFSPPDSQIPGHPSHVLDPWVTRNGINWEICSAGFRENIAHHFRIDHWVGDEEIPQQQSATASLNREKRKSERCLAWIQGKEEREVRQSLTSSFSQENQWRVFKASNIWWKRSTDCWCFVSDTTYTFHSLDERENSFPWPHDDQKGRPNFRRSTVCLLSVSRVSSCEVWFMLQTAVSIKCMKRDLHHSVAHVSINCLRFPSQ